MLFYSNSENLTDFSVMTIIFDLGGVTLTWSFDVLLSSVFQDENDKKNVYMNAIKNPFVWKDFDRGITGVEETINRAVASTNLPHSKIKQLLDNIRLQLLPVPETLDIIKNLKGKGHKLYVLSNMPPHLANYLEKKYEFWNMFDGIMFSGRTKMAKPDAEIFYHLIEKFNIDIENAIFVDDLQPCIEVAKKIGFKTILFTSPKQCNHELEKYGCL